MNKKTFFILLFFVLIFLAIATLFYFNKKKEEKRVSEEKNIISTTASLKQLQTENMNLTDRRLVEYFKMAGINDLEVCENRADEYDCKTSIAHIKKDRNYCHSDKNEEVESQCLKMMIKMNSYPELKKCEVFEDDKYFNCLLNVFVVYAKADCSSLSDEYSKAVCSDAFNYLEIYEKYDRNLCNQIFSEKIKKYCFTKILPLSQVGVVKKSLAENEEVAIDADQDGLSDSDEIAIYKTYPNNPDTDGDGYSDGEEVKNGFNPLGEGKLIQ